jgi:hypothetical membrane protein
MAGVTHVGGAAVTSVGGFTDRHPLVGPAVLVSSTLYFAAQVAAAWVWNPPYSVVSNTISDLGRTTSPRHVLMNAAFVLLGVVMALGSLLIYQEFRNATVVQQRGALLGFSIMALAGIGAVLVGLFPENRNHVAHLTGAALAIGGGIVAIFILGWVLELPMRLATFTRFWAPVAMVALVLFACHRDFGLGAGTMERIAGYPVTIWLIAFGLYMARGHVTQPQLLRRLLLLGTSDPQEAHPTGQ